MPIDLKKKSDTESANFIRAKRTRVFKMSQDEFAEAFSVQVGTLRNWEQGINEPPAYFLQLISAEEEKLSNGYSTPIESSRLMTTRMTSASVARQFASDSAKDAIEKNNTQKAIYELVRNMTDENGILENLQKISTYFDDYNTTDIAALAQVVLLQSIDKKLDKLIEYAAEGK